MLHVENDEEKTEVDAGMKVPLGGLDKVQCYAYILSIFLVAQNKCWTDRRMFHGFRELRRMHVHGSEKFRASVLYGTVKSACQRN